MTITHRMAGTPEHKAWNQLKVRCTAPKSKYFHLYGGRGITVCDRWLKFENFYADVGPRPSPKHSLDRINVNGNYEPGNVRWTTMKVQQRNRTNNRHLEWAGMSMTLAEWCERAEMNYKTVHTRLTDGWPWPQALYTPVFKAGSNRANSVGALRRVDDDASILAELMA